jgi:kynurenine formamidase
MSTLTSLLADLAQGRVAIVDLTAPLSDTTPVIQLPPPFANTNGFSLQEISNYDERGPAWYWNNISAGEHVGTHFVGPAVVVDKSAECAANPDFLLEIEHLEGWQAEHGPLPAGGWLLYRTGWDTRADDQADFLNANETGPHTPGISVACARWLAEQPILGVGVETVGTDAGTAHSFDPPFPCHSFLLGAGKYGLTQLANVAQLPTTGAVLIAAPLPIVGGSGSPARVLALVPR